MKTSNKNCGQYIINRQAFIASNIFAEYVTQNANGDQLDTCRYVVYSYGKHFPMYIFEGGVWYANCDKYSVSTSKHQSQANPCIGQQQPPTPMDTKQMLTIVRYGIAGLAAMGVEGARYSEHGVGI